MSKAIVALTRCTNYETQEVAKSLQRQFELLGGVERFVKRGDRILIKPNFIAPRSRHHATATHPVVVTELARLLIDFGARPFVGDSPAWSNVYQCAEKLKLTEPLKKLGVEIMQLDHPKKCQLTGTGTTVGISSVALDADVIINLPKFKSHQQLVATFAVKNMFGCVSGKAKAMWHFRKGHEVQEFCELLIDIYKHLAPAVTIIDAVYAMDGPGPIRGRTRPLGWFIGGVEPIACECVCANLIGLSPDDLPIVKTASKLGFGFSNLSKIEIVGDDLPDEPCKDFAPAQPMPIRFSLGHVVKSISKQMLILLRQSKAE